MHFYSDRYPAAPGAPTKPGGAWIDAYRDVQSRLGLERVVIVQPIAYGRDNTCQLEALAAFGESARGVMVVDDTVEDVELERLTGLGVRGVRFHMLPGGALPWKWLEKIAARVAAFGWHVQLQMNGHEFVERLALLKRLPCPLVVDHVGRFMPPVGADHDAFHALQELIDGDRCWVKLSAPYESSRSGPPDYADVTPLARALVRAAPERLLWASNWPHPGQMPPPSEAALLDLLLKWCDDEATRDRILADNPADLYGF